VNAEQILTDVLRNGTQYELEAGVKVKRGRVAGQNVVQLIAGNPNVLSNLKKMGVIHEISAQPIYYLPAEKAFGGGYVKAQDILEKILKEYPAKVEGGEVQATDVGP